MENCDTVEKIKTSELKKAISSVIKNDMNEIENELKKHLSPYLELVKEIAGYLLFAGGKRIRPLLMILASRICGYSGTFDKTLSIVFEYLHAATLLHDDIIDGAELRRGKSVAHSIWGNSEVVLTGDFLFAKASGIAADSGNIEIVKILSMLIQKMTQGEIYQLLRQRQLDLTEEEYFDIIHYKTGFMIESACKVGAILAEASPQKLKALSTFGSKLGTVFQMVDDMLDYTAEMCNLGKNTGIDLKEGKLTLPVIYSLKHANEKDRVFMENIIKNKNFSAEQFVRFRKLLIKYGGIEYAENLAEKYTSEAISALSVFENSETKDTLLMIADYFLRRKE